MTAEKKSPARKPRQATAPVMEKIIDVEPIGKPGPPQVEAHEISTKTQRAEDSQAEALRDLISRDTAAGRRGEPGRHDVGSAFRLAEVARSLTLESWSPDALARLRGARVVLVDDWTDSGGTLAGAGRLLLRAGAADVRPLVLAQR